MVVTTENSIILSKTSKPLYRGQLLGVFSNGGEVNIDDKYGIRISKVSTDFYHIKLLIYGEKPAYKVNKFVKIKKVIEKVPVIKYKKPLTIKKIKKDYEMKIEREVDLFEDM